MSNETLKVLEVIFAGITAVGVIGGGIIALIKGVAFLTKISATLDLLVTNHLPHIDAELKGLRADVNTLMGTHGQHPTS